MNSELIISGVSGQALAEMMGVSSSNDDGTKRASNLARLSIMSKPIMGDFESNGKVRKTEVLPVGAYRLKVDDEFVYCLNPEIRIFSLKEQWTHWDSVNNAMDRSLMANNLYGDLKDSKGTFNIGRPTGYHSKKEYDALSQSTKDLMRSVKRTKIIFGTVNFNGLALDENGNEVTGYDGQIPFILDTKNKDSINALRDALDLVKQDSKLPIEAKLLKRSFILGAKIESVPQTYATILFTVKGEVDLEDQDSKTFESFQDWIIWSNTYVLDKWKEHNVQELSQEDADLTEQFVEIEEFTGAGV
jgi:hypothetical protein